MESKLQILQKVGCIWSLQVNGIEVFWKGNIGLDVNDAGHVK